uniref:Uncharacterized protein n=1 Tax=Chromera velia CCMP2878 TaxID=1169474 RepID=A0A0G4H957_9ALVE|eukprot:Cvel_25350.t1-p1 / transcript=Cvel_25350.t1 / gene=Cvel_25350 / organism=Chromera_velia_CCMP2878 / gene_product=hypothetical protein / transcript_product=hypothetical protein / location=Cvel_scaffold2859:22760-23008(+) / protein_length=83 / sequence_SO=supercontig / SO=protein_coding / is_pseudo=false
MRLWNLEGRERGSDAWGGGSGGKCPLGGITGGELARTGQEVFAEGSLQRDFVRRRTPSLGERAGSLLSAVEAGARGASSLCSY